VQCLLQIKSWGKDSEELSATVALLGDAPVVGIAVDLGGEELLGGPGEGFVVAVHELVDGAHVGDGIVGDEGVGASLVGFGENTKRSVNSELGGIERDINGGGGGISSDINSFDDNVTGGLQPGVAKGSLGDTVSPEDPVDQEVNLGVLEAVRTVVLGQLAGLVGANLADASVEANPVNDTPVAETELEAEVTLSLAGGAIGGVGVDGGVGFDDDGVGSGLGDDDQRVDDHGSVDDFHVSFGVDGGVGFDDDGVGSGLGDDDQRVDDHGSVDDFHVSFGGDDFNFNDGGSGSVPGDAEGKGSDALAIESPVVDAGSVAIGRDLVGGIVGLGGADIGEAGVEGGPVDVASEVVGDHFALVSLSIGGGAHGVVDWHLNDDLLLDDDLVNNGLDLDSPVNAELLGGDALTPERPVDETTVGQVDDAVAFSAQSIGDGSLGGASQVHALVEIEPVSG